MKNKIAVDVVTTCVWFLVFLIVLSLVKLAGGDSFLGYSILVACLIGWVFSLWLIVVGEER
jgi:hypothetical protein